MSRTHPSAREIATWFDEEGASWVADHVAGCDRCRMAVGELARVRAAIRGEPFVGSAGYSGRRRTGILVLAATLMLFAVISSAWAAGVRAPFTAVAHFFEGGRHPTHVSRPIDRQPGGSGGPSSGAGRNLSRSPVAHGIPGRPAHPLRPKRSVPAIVPSLAPPALKLAVVAPLDGPGALEGNAVVRAVRRAVASANADGGVGGVQVRLDVVPAGHPIPRGRLVVGGFGATPAPGSTWLLPADPSIQGQGVVRAEASARDAGAILGSDLRRRGITGPVGIVVGGGPDAGLAAGLRRLVPALEVTATAGTSCDLEVSLLRSEHADTLAVAGPADLQTRCADALARSGWRPDGGLLLPPSAAYAGLQGRPSVQGARTVLGFPWPSSDDPGAARFRSAVPLTGSYRALVSYAAAELAIQVARERGSVDPAALSGRTWRSDLYWFSGTTNMRERVVTAWLDGWTPSSRGDHGSGGFELPGLLSPGSANTPATLLPR